MTDPFASAPTPPPADEPADLGMWDTPSDNDTASAPPAADAAADAASQPDWDAVAAPLDAATIKVSYSRVNADGDLVTFEAQSRLELADALDKADIVLARAAEYRTLNDEVREALNDAVAATGAAVAALGPAAASQHQAPEQQGSGSVAGRHPQLQIGKTPKNGDCPWLPLNVLSKQELIDWAIPELAKIVGIPSIAEQIFVGDEREDTSWSTGLASGGQSYTMAVIRARKESKLAQMLGEKKHLVAGIRCDYQGNLHIETKQHFDALINGIKMAQGGGA